MKLDTLFDNFEMLADAPSGVPKLREMILQMAVQGKLVPQDPNDEPASVLLEKIKAEKDRLIKEKKIKKAKPLPPIEPDEIPFSPPKGWGWERLGSIGITQTGTTPSKSNPTYFGKDISFIKPADISETNINYDNEGLSSKGIEKGRFIEKSSILMVCIGGSIGKVNIIDRPCSCNQQINTLTPFQSVSHELLNYFMRSTYFQNEVVNRAPKTTLPILSKGKWELILIPLPPTKEQTRIVTKVDQLMALCDELEARKQKRDKSRIALNDAALDRLLSARKQKDFTKHWNRISNYFNLLYDTSETVNKLRQAILQLAVQGKLVPQDPKDPPASVLLEKIKVEKERLIKEKKIKKTKPLPPISPDEIPYELPEKWEWARPDDFSQKITDGEHFRPPTQDKGVYFLSAKDIRSDGVSLGDPLFISKETAKKALQRCNPEIGDILIVSRGATVGRMCTVDIKDVFCLLGSVILIKPLWPILSEYLKYVMKTPQAFGQLLSASGSTAQPAIYLRDIKKIVFPIAPLAEQHRLVAKVDELMALCNEMETKLSQSQSDCDELLNAIVSNIENVSVKD